MVEALLAGFPVVKESLRKTFNTATVQLAVSGKFEPTPLKAPEVESFLAAGFRLPHIDVSDRVQPFAERWWKDLKEELEPLAGKSIDPRFIAGIEIY